MRALFTQYNLGGDHPLVGRGVPPTFSFSKTVPQLVSSCTMAKDTSRFCGNTHCKNLQSRRIWQPIEYLCGQAKKQLGLSAALNSP